jgi:hypothetical protein
MGKVVTLIGAGGLQFAGKPDFAATPGALPAPDENAPATLDFSKGGVEVRTDLQSFCVNGQGVVLERFLTTIFNVHTHPVAGAAAGPTPQQALPAPNIVTPC